MTIRSVFVIFLKETKFYNKYYDYNSNIIKLPRILFYELIFLIFF